MEMSHGEGFDFFLEAAGVPHIVLPEAEKALAINAKVVLVGRAAQQVPMYLETYQVRRSQFFGAQGHSGDANFPNVIRLVASGRLDLRPIITARYNLEQVVDAIAALRLTIGWEDHGVPELGDQIRPAFCHIPGKGGMRGQVSERR